PAPASLRGFSRHRNRARDRSPDHEPSRRGDLGRGEGRRRRDVLFRLQGIRGRTPMSKTILLVEDNPDDVKLTLRAFKRNNMMNPIVVARDGVEALDYLFGRGAYADRAEYRLP